ncbi:mannosyl-3-phosphoglycerate synthase [Podospora aff. communis PSN243]|uniref:Mannosyl-3-phosphoglycerate synthase n=1 Tax=Podospora aff. communis PSN243 TaxID=3040156 RepID=A0AAV9GML9_9PEZI|nr:mannosyl-3-phosphoglycerate synthase [Podospora aff. communis PSN243]
MRVTTPTNPGHVGHITIDREIEVVELDAGEAPTRLIADPNGETVGVPPLTLNKILSKMAIIVPCKNEPPETIRGVLTGIPKSCTIILVSNSRRAHSEDRYAREAAILQEFCKHGRKALAIHQKDPCAAAAICSAGMPELLDAARLIRNGKGEGMILGLAVVAALCPDVQYVGFVDADSKIPGSTHEYCRIFASGFAVSGHPSPSEDEHVMVRVHWSAKPKVREGRIDFSVAEGRSSCVVNYWLNRYLNLVWEGHAAQVTTANAGEHAMTMSLALKMRMAGGYAIEPFHYVDLLKRQLNLVATPNTSPPASVIGSEGVHSDSDSVTSSDSSSSYSSSLESIPVRVMQIRSLNPHFHNETGDDHITAMWGTGLSTIYHHLLDSSEYDDKMADLKSEMEEFVMEKTGNMNSLHPPMVYPPLEVLDLPLLASGLQRATSLQQI